VKGKEAVNSLNLQNVDRDGSMDECFGSLCTTFVCVSLKEHNQLIGMDGTPCGIFVPVKYWDIPRLIEALYSGHKANYTGSLLANA
jgi:hypothetical protein